MSEKVDEPTDAGGNAALVRLLAQAAGGDERAFEELYELTVERLFGLALRVTRERDVAEEAVGDAYLQIWRQAHTYSAARGPVIAWLCVVTRSRALDALRRHGTLLRRAEIPLERAPEPLADDPSQDLLDATDRHSRLHAALRELSVAERQLLSLAYFRGFTHQELAAVTRQPLGTVKTQLHRATKRLRTLMPDPAQARESGDGERHG